MKYSLGQERTESEANVSASGAGGLKFKFCHPDQYLHESGPPGALFLLFSGPILVRITSLSHNLLLSNLVLVGFGAGFSHRGRSGSEERRVGFEEPPSLASF